MNRHKLTIWCFAAMGATCSAIGFIQYAAPEFSLAITILYIISKFFASCSYTGKMFQFDSLFTLFSYPDHFNRSLSD